MGNDSLTGAAIYFGSMGPEAAANASVGTKDGVPSVSVTLDCPEACASLQVLGARYSAEGQLLGLETVTVPSGASGAIEVPFGDGSVVKVFAIDSDAGIPVCAAVERVRP